jgi:hypothetical protein
MKVGRVVAALEELGCPVIRDVELGWKRPSRLPPVVAREAKNA